MPDYPNAPVGVGTGGISLDPDLIYGDGPFPTGDEAPVGVGPGGVNPGGSLDAYYGYYYPPGTYIPGYGYVQPPRGPASGGAAQGGLPTWLLVALGGVAAGVAYRALSR